MLATQGTKTKGRPQPLGNIIARGQFTPNQLPKEDFDFERDSSCPDIFEVQGGRARTELPVNRAGGVGARGIQAPSNLVVEVRWHPAMDLMHKVVPFNLFIEAKGPTKGDMPPMAISGLGNGDGWLTTDGEEAVTRDHLGKSQVRVPQVD